MMREIAIKRVKDNWIDEFSNLLDKVENKEFKKVGRNEKCPCGSGKKFKHCHGNV